MSNSLLDYFEQASEEIDPENDIFSDSNDDIKDVFTKSDTNNNTNSNINEEPKTDSASEDDSKYTYDTEYTYDTDDDDEDNYDVNEDERRQGISIAKVAAITLYAVIFLFAFVGALTLFLPNVRLELFATFFS